MQDQPLRYRFHFPPEDPTPPVARQSLSSMLLLVFVFAGLSVAISYLGEHAGFPWQAADALMPQNRIWCSSRAYRTSEPRLLGGLPPCSACSVGVAGIRQRIQI